MKTYNITLEFGADLLQTYECEDETLLNEPDLYHRIIERDGFDIVEDDYYMCCINGLYASCDNECVDGLHSGKYKINYDKLTIPEKGIYAIGGHAADIAYFSLELPDDEIFDWGKVEINGWACLIYHLDDKTKIQAELSYDGDNSFENGDIIYVDGKNITEPD